MFALAAAAGSAIGDLGSGYFARDIAKIQAKSQAEVERIRAATARMVAEHEAAKVKETIAAPLAPIKEVIGKAFDFFPVIAFAVGFLIVLSTGAGFFLSLFFAALAGVGSYLLMKEL